MHPSIGLQIVGFNIPQPETSVKVTPPFPAPVFEERTHGREKPGRERGWPMGFRLEEFGSSS
jgi:hypothetical protein